MCVRTRVRLSGALLFVSGYHLALGLAGGRETVAGILPAASAQDGELVQYQATEGGMRHRF